MMDIKPGNILIVTTNLPFVKHIGICVTLNNELYVLHNTPSKFNVYGGNVIFEPLTEFMNQRKILKIIECYISNEFIVSNSMMYKFHKWDAKFFNCENFINYIANLNIDPTQSQLALGGLSIFLLTIYLFV